MFTYPWWLNLATFIGILILAVPVLSLNSRKRKLHRVKTSDTTATTDSDFRTQVRGILSEKHKDNIERWRGRDQFCLLTGYTLLLGASFLRLLVSGV
jgi:hypothetical protein